MAKIEVSVKDMALFKDFSELLLDLAAKDDDVRERLNSILAKHCCGMEVEKEV